MAWHNEGTEMQQVAMSYELLQLLQWFVENDQQGLQQLVARAIHQGFADQLKKNPSETDMQDMQERIIEYFMVLETMLYHELHNQQDQHILHNGIIPALKHLDPHTYDEQAVEASAHKAVNAYARGQNVKEVLCKELLKRWKPIKSDSIN